MEQMIQSAENFIKWAIPGAWVLVAVALIINGIAFIVGSEEARTKAKKALPYVLLGCLMFLGAVTIGKEIIAQIVF